MSHTTRTSLIAAALAGAVIVPSAAQAQATPTTLATEQAPTRVAAWESTVMWSRLDPATGRYALLKSVDGAAPTPVAVPQRSGGPFDIDLGTSRSGSTFAVYTRNGDIYRLNVASGAETKVAGLSSPKLERNPTIQNGKIAFIRRSGRLDELRISKATNFAKGSRVVVRRGSIPYAELGNRHVAYVTQGLDAGNVGETQVHVRNLSTANDKARLPGALGRREHPRRSRGRASSPSPRASCGRGRTSAPSGGNRLVRYTLRGGKLAYDQGSMTTSRRPGPARRSARSRRRRSAAARARRARAPARAATPASPTARSC